MPRHRWIVYKEVKKAVRIGQVLERIDHPFTKKADGHLQGPCPLHGDQDARHFRVSRSGRAFKCFGCGQGGNVLDLVAGLEGVEIREAASLLIDWFKLSRTAATRRPPRTVAPAEKRSARSTSATDV